MSDFVGRFDESCLPNMEEFDKRYKGTYVWVEREDKEGDYFKYTNNAYSPSGIKLIFENSKGKVITSEYTKTNISVRLPETGYFNPTNISCAYLFTRKPARQFKRGISSDNIRMYSPLRNKVAIQKIPTSIGGEYLKDALLKNFMSLDNALRCLNNRVSVALNSMFAISLSWLDDRPFLWFYDNIVGLINVEKQIIQVNKLYLQEVKDLIEGTVWKLELLKN